MTQTPVEEVAALAGSRPSAGPAGLDGEVAVYMDNVSVVYRVPHERIPSLKEYAIRRLRGQFTYEDFWALRDLSLTVRRGESVGIVGSNGAGKSTLLKMVARIFRPTRGRVIVKGQVVPLLELGAAFHPELTGVENVYLNATLLGYTRKETEARFKDIVDFAELWDFIDAPLRTYSSGMAARLGFATGTAWAPDVLIIDEILSVGDDAFQRKSRARILSFQEQGSTVLLVTHDPGLVQAVCQRAIWLDHGQIRMDGPPEEVLAAYAAR
jgi:ABC-type polysaccharide/polyol phosphate transport system ATPase subunit